MAERVGFELEASRGVGARSRNPGATGTTVNMAERVGFEPTVGVNLHTLSKRAP